MKTKWTISILTAVFIGSVCTIILWQRQPIRRLYKLAAICSTRLRAVDSAKGEWAVANQKTTNDPPPTLEDLSSFVSFGHDEPTPCPCGGIYTVGKLGVPAKCSLSEEEH